MKQPKRRRLSQSRLKVYSYYGASRSSDQEKAVGARGSSHQTFGHLVRGIRQRFSLFRLFIVILGVAGLAVFFNVDTTAIIRLDEKIRATRGVDNYRDKSRQIIGSSILNRSKLTFNYSSVEDDLKKEFPEIESVRISFDLFGSKPVFQLTLRPAVFRVISSSQTWVIDDRGVVIGQDDTVSASTELPVITDEIGLQVQQGNQLLSEGETTFLTEVYDLLAAKQIQVTSLYIPLIPKQLDVQLNGEGWRYKFNTEEKASDQVGFLLATRETLKARGETPAEYVDLRSGEKVFWK